MKIRDTLISILPKSIQNWFKNRNIKMLESARDSKYRKECLETGREQEFDTYLVHKENIKNDIKMFKNNISNGKEVKRWEYELKDAKGVYEFIRPNEPSDINYRNYWADNFASRLQEVAPEYLDIRFHGTPIYNAKAILESGGIFSSVDINDGYLASTDLSGEISTTSIDTINRTLQGWFAGIASYNRNLPCGCIFALLPRDERDKQLKSQDAMQSINFREHPEQLYGIITTNENIPNVRQWLQNAGLDIDLATNFEGFLEKVSKERNAAYEFRNSNAINQSDLNREYGMTGRLDVGQTERLDCYNDREM